MTLIVNTKLNKSLSSNGFIIPCMIIKDLFKCLVGDTEPQPSFGLPKLPGVSERKICGMLRTQFNFVIRGSSDPKGENKNLKKIKLK